MKSLIWKDWRELVKWCPPPAVLILGPMILTGVPVLLDEVYCFAVSLVAGIFGAMLAFLQFFPDTRGDRRSMLLHLPLSRPRIFLAKAIAGVSLYALAMAVPFACVVGLSAAGGFVPAPFSWQLSLPWLADILTGLVYYFAGALVAQREAAWMGSRLLPLGAGLLTSIVVWTVAEFQHALVIVALMGGFVALAAWTSMLADPGRSAIRRLGRLSEAVTLLREKKGSGVAL